MNQCMFNLDRYDERKQLFIFFEEAPTDLFTQNYLKGSGLRVEAKKLAWTYTSSVITRIISATRICTAGFGSVLSILLLNILTKNCDVDHFIIRMHTCSLGFALLRYWWSGWYLGTCSEYWYIGSTPARSATTKYSTAPRRATGRYLVEGIIHQNNSKLHNWSASDQGLPFACTVDLCFSFCGLPREQRLIQNNISTSILLDDSRQWPLHTCANWSFISFEVVLLAARVAIRTWTK